MEERFVYDELVYDGRVVQVHKVGIRARDGEVLARDFLHYPGAAVILPVLADGSIVLIRNYRFAVQENLWELAAGAIEEGEDPAVCAARELTEETGYTAASIKKLGTFCSAPGASDELFYVYLATGLTDGPQRLEGYEEITVEVFGDAAIRKMVSDGVIHDSKTIATLALYWLGADQGKGM